MFLAKLYFDMRSFTGADLVCTHHLGGGVRAIRPIRRPALGREREGDKSMVLSTVPGRGCKKLCHCTYRRIAVGTVPRVAASLRRLLDGRLQAPEVVDLLALVAAHHVLYGARLHADVALGAGRRRRRRNHRCACRRRTGFEASNSNGGGCRCRRQRGACPRTDANHTADGAQQFGGLYRFGAGGLFQRLVDGGRELFRIEDGQPTVRHRLRRSADRFGRCRDFKWRRKRKQRWRRRRRRSRSGCGSVGGGGGFDGGGGGDGDWSGRCWRCL